MRLTSISMLCAGVVVLAACQTTTGGTGSTAAPSGGLLTNVEIYEGTTFTATWANSPSTTVRLAYDAATVVTDDELGEIVQQLTGCSRVDGQIPTEFFGGMVTALIPATC